MADKKQQQEESEKTQIPTEIIMDLEEGLKAPMKEFIYKAFSNETNPLKMCDYIKTHLQEKQEGKWNVVIGRDFASDIVHRSRKYGLYKVGELSILIWQSGGLDNDKD